MGGTYFGLRGNTPVGLGSTSCVNGTSPSGSRPGNADMVKGDDFFLRPFTPAPAFFLLFFATAGAFVAAALAATADVEGVVDGFDAGVLAAEVDSVLAVAPLWFAGGWCDAGRPADTLPLAGRFAGGAAAVCVVRAFATALPASFCCSPLPLSGFFPLALALALAFAFAFASPFSSVFAWLLFLVAFPAEALLPSPSPDEEDEDDEDDDEGGRESAALDARTAVTSAVLALLLVTLLLLLLLLLPVEGLLLLLLLLVVVRCSAAFENCAKTAADIGTGASGSDLTRAGPPSAVPSAALLCDEVFNDEEANGLKGAMPVAALCCCCQGCCGTIEGTPPKALFKLAQAACCCCCCCCC